jgi:hypothetical protein
MSNLADIVASVGADLNSPRIIATIDKVVVHLLSLRQIAAGIHGDTTPAPVVLVEAAQSKAGPAPPPPPPPDENRTSNQRAKTNHTRTLLLETVADLVERYRSDDRSPYKKLRHKTRSHYDSCIRRVLNDAGPDKLADIKRDTFQRYYQMWTGDGKISMAHGLIAIMRSIVHFGADPLLDKECERLAFVLHNMRFKIAKRADVEHITDEQIATLIANANKMGFPSIALAQALQSGCKLPQKDIIGEWVPEDEPGDPHVVDGGLKWGWGLRFEEIQEVGNGLMLRHITSRRGDEVVFNLRNMPLVMEELNKLPKPFPPKGPLIVSEKTGLPWHGASFRRQWRLIATASNISKKAKNMDTRSTENANHRMNGSADAAH